MLPAKVEVTHFYGIISNDPDPLVRGTDSDPIGSIIKQK